MLRIPMEEVKKEKIPLSSILNLESISVSPAAKSSMISVSSSSAVEKRKLGKPRDGDPELDGEAVLRRSDFTRFFL